MRLFKTRLLVFTILLLIQCLSDFSSIVFADNLKSVMQSKSYRKLKSASERRNKIFIDPDSNFAKVFKMKSEGVPYVIDWLGKPSEDFNNEKLIFSQNKNLVRVERTLYSRKTLEPIKLLVLVPKPYKQTAAEFGLIPEFQKMSPPFLKATSQSKIIRQDISGELYILGDKGGCLLNFKLAKGTMLSLHALKCLNPRILIELIEQLDITNLNSKLQS